MMEYDREEDEARALRQTDARADGFPELPLGIEAFRSPLHTLPSDVPTRRRSHEALTVYFIVASMAVALGVLAAFAMREPSTTLTEASADLMALPALAKPPVVPARVIRAGAVDPAQLPSAPTPDTSAPHAPTKSVASTLSTANRGYVRRTTSARRGKSGAQPRTTAAAQRTRPPARKMSDQPSRNAVLAAMRGVTSDARSCLNGTAVAQVHITFKGETGKVLSATVHGVQGAAASCVARAVRAARLPPFSKAQLKITFPFRAGG